MTPAPTLDELISTVQAAVPTGDALERLAEALRTVGQLEEVGDALLGYYVELCRAQGRSWSEISSALGVSKQAAHKRFSPAADRPVPLDRFTPRAREVLRIAADEARRLEHGEVRTEHLLLGLFADQNALAARILAEAGIDRGAVEAQVRAAVPHASPGPMGELPFVPATVDALRGSAEEALRLGHNYVGTEHLLLGLYRTPGDPAAAILASLGADPDDLRQRVKDKLASLRI
jgi:hypothetical protein